MPAVTPNPSAGTVTLSTSNDAASWALFRSFNNVRYQGQWYNYTYGDAGSTLNFSFTGTAPATPGTYSYNWTMRTAAGTTFGQVCSKQLIIVPACTDNDNDQYNQSGGPAVCGSVFDCNDGDALIHPNLAENAGYCDDGKDNDCDGQADYDGRRLTPMVHGDRNCPVGVSNAAAITPVCAGGWVVANCTSSVPNVRSINARITQGASARECDYLEWAGTTVRFNCSTAGFASGAATILCYVNQSRSYQSGANSSIGVQLSGQDQQCLGAAGTCGTNGVGICSGSVCVDNVRWMGNVTDGKSIYPIGVAATVNVDKNGFAAPLGIISVPGVCLGTHNLTGDAADYDPTTILNVPFNTDPTYKNIPLSPPSCHADCTYMGFCNAKCVGQNGCAVNASYTALEQGNITWICEGARANTTRVFNSTTMVQCCAGPLLPSSLYQTPFTSQSCSENIVPHKTLVNYNGRFLELTVLSYDKCE
jgi:hypothetical protein